MTEEEWLACVEPDVMLTYLRGKASDRKLRLFACACCRDVWHWLLAPESRQAVAVAERYADGEATLEALFAARHEALSPALHSDPGATAAWNAAGHPDDEEFAEWYAGRGIIPTTVEVALSASGNVWQQSDDGPDEWPFSRRSAQEFQSGLLRDLFGNPFRPVIADPVYLTPTVASLAQAAYEARDLSSGELDLSRLAVLSDALEEAGCNDADILSHLRGPGPHARGCWVIDLLLGRS